MYRKFFGLAFAGILALGSLAATPAAYAAFVDDFEDGDTVDWLETASGSGSFGVQPHNASQMAFTTQSGNGSHSLSIDFGYMADSLLSFDMHAVASTGGSSSHGITQAASGVTLSFLNAFNTVLGKFRWMHHTSPSSLGPTDILIDGLQHEYGLGLSMGDLAAQAGLGATDPISKLSLSYFTSAQTNVFNDRSNATVWFDNVEVSAVPVPVAAWLMGSGLIGLLGFGRRRQRQS